MSDLYDAIAAVAAEVEPLDGLAEPATGVDVEAEDEEAERERVLQLAIVGRPNVGKSTLVNTLIGADRLMSRPEAGSTRASIAIDWPFTGRALRLVDTAGLRRRAGGTGTRERHSTHDHIPTLPLPP